MNGHPALHAREERARALATIMAHLTDARAHLHAAQYINLAHGLGLDLPPEAAFLDAANACAKLHQQPEAPHGSP